VILGPETRRRLGDGFAVDDLGDRTLRHVEEPLRVYRLL
jgi:class 3 adenylate cyclase